MTQSDSLKGARFRRLLTMLLVVEVVLGSFMLVVPHRAHLPPANAAALPMAAASPVHRVADRAPEKVADRVPESPVKMPAARPVVTSADGGVKLLQTPAMAAVPVMVATAARRDVPIYLDGLGTAVASALVTVRAQVDGTLQDVRFQEGEDVRAGEVLAKIDPRSYQASLDQALAKKQQDQATLANARLDLARYQKLSANAYSSAQQTDTARATVAQLEAQVAQDQAMVDNARTQLSYTTIIAPVAGRTGIRQVDAGNVVHAADTSGIVVITTLRPISVIFTLPQQMLPQVASAMRGEKPDVLAYPQGDDRALLDHGKLAVLDNQVDQSTGTIKLKASFPNDDLKLWPGAFVTVRLKVDTRRNATVVPPLSIQRGPNGAFVFVVASDLTVTRRSVTIGHEDVGTSVVEEGLRPGEIVVTDGASRLTDNAKVTVVRQAPLPMAQPAVHPGAQPTAERFLQAPVGETRDAGLQSSARREAGMQLQRAATWDNPPPPGHDKPL